MKGVVRIWCVYVIVFSLFGCTLLPTKKLKKTTAASYNKQVLHITGHDSLDINLTIFIPKKEKINYKLRLSNLDKSGYHTWRDTSWSNMNFDTSLTTFLQLIHQQPHRKAKNATYQYVHKKWKLIEEVSGTEIDTLGLRKVLQKALNNQLKSINLIHADLYVKPFYHKESEELEVAKKELEKALKSSIELSYGQSKFVLDESVFVSWLSLDEKLKVKVDYISAQNYIQDIAQKIEQPLSEILALNDSQLQTDSLMNQTFPRMPIFQEVEFILNTIPKGKVVQRPIVFVPQGLPKGLKQGLKDFVEVSILDQKLWLFKNGQLVLETSVVTGNKKYNRATPTGHYHILYKTKDRILRGRDYASFVKYWMPFYKGYGLHDAMWRRRFGANIYQNGGSHGCVNIPPKMAPLIYNNVVVGMDVIIRQ